MFNKFVVFSNLINECKDLDLAKLPEIHRMLFQLTRYYLRDEMSGKIHSF